MTELAHFPADADPDRVHERLLADGAVILDGVLTPDEADAIRAELDPWVQATAPGRDGFTGFSPDCPRARGGPPVTAGT
ncbi:MAG: hypothetical protein INF01_02620 [Phenylobacterium sp.]|nr:hypothetical protein [Phenylobacterium sp.]